MGIVTEHRKVIDGIAYSTKTFPATEGLDLMFRLGNSVGQKALTVFFSMRSDKEAAVITDDPAIMSAIVMDALRNIESGGPELVRDMLRHTTCDKIAIGNASVEGSVYEHFDTHFAGNYRHLLEVIMWVGQVSFVRP